MPRLREKNRVLRKLRIEKFNDEDSVEKYNATEMLILTVDYRIFLLHAIFIAWFESACKSPNKILRVQINICSKSFEIKYLL